MGITKKQALAFSAKSNGLHERVHRTMTLSLRCLLTESQEKNWAKLLPFIELGLRSSVGPNSNLTPMEIWLGRSVRLPIDVALNVKPEISSDSPEGYIQQIRKRISLMYQVQRETDAQARKAMKEKYDMTKARPEVFTEGMLVYLHDNVLKGDQVRKTTNVWRGPFKIIENNSEHSVRLSDIYTGEILKSLIHVDRLKKCNNKEEAFIDTTELESNEPLSCESILEQKGRAGSLKYLLRYGTRKDGSRSEDKWLKPSDVPEALIASWHMEHRKSDGAIRKRKLSQERRDETELKEPDRPIGLQSDVSDTESERSDSEEKEDVQIIHDEGVDKDKATKVLDGICRSPRNLIKKEL